MEPSLLAELEEKLGLVFQDKRLLERAFTHHSSCPETANVDAYDPLEFLGDAVLGRMWWSTSIARRRARAKER